MNFDRIPGVWFVFSAAVYVVGLLCSLVLAPPAFITGFSIGGALVLLNAWASARRVKGAQFPHRNRVMATVLSGFYIRMIVLGICLFAVISVLNVDPVGLVAGLSVVPAGLFFMLIMMLFVNRRPEEV
jgi:hypothetical protein